MNDFHALRDFPASGGGNTSDFHTHSTFSPDASDSLRDNVLSAVKRNCKYLGMTEHLNFDLERHGFAAPPLEIEAYKREFKRLRADFDGVINLTFGVEVGFDPKEGGRYRDYIQKYGFDYVINSVHLVNGESYYRGYFDKYSEKQAFVNYMRAVRASLDAPYLFHSVGHFGCLMRGCLIRGADMYSAAPDLADDILKVMIARGIALEINAGVGAAPPPALPAKNILLRYRELGGDLIVYGSDAHSSDGVTRSFYEITAYLSECGFKYHAAFTADGTVMLPLGAAE